MEYRITNLMTLYEDDIIDIEDSEYLSVERVRQLTFEKLGITPPKKSRKIGRTFLMSLAAALALSATAFAVYQFTMADRVVENAEQWETEAGDTLVEYSTVGYNSSPMADIPEYMAYTELVSYEQEVKTYDARLLLSYDDPHRLYGYGYENMADKIDEIAEKYSLRTWQKQAIVDTADELSALLGIQSFGILEDDQCQAAVYDDGSFEARGFVLYTNDGIEVNFIRAAKGSLSKFYLTGYTPETYTYESYVTTSGTTVDLALHEKEAMIFVELNSCYITVELGANGKLQTMEQLRAIADTLNFAALDSIDTSAVATTVTTRYAEQNTAADNVHANTKEDAELVFGLLGDRSLPIVPDGYYLHSTYVNTPEESLDNLWVHLYGGCFAEISINYDSYNEEPLKSIGLRYSRYWTDMEMTQSITQDSFKNQKAYMQAEHEASPDMFSELTECMVNGNEAYYYTISGVRQISWYDQESDLFYVLTAPTDFSTKELISMAESICLK